MTGGVVVSDMDGTLSTAEAWRGTYRWLRANHPTAHTTRFLLVRLPQVILVRLGLIDKEAFRVRWLRDLAGLLRGLDEATLTAMGEWAVEHHLWPSRRQEAIDALAAAIREAQAGNEPVDVILATASYQPVADAFARRIGAGVALATPLEMRDGRATGALAAPVQSQAEKAAGVASQAAGRRVLAAFGDSGGDIPMLALAARAVAVAPDKALRRAASERGWEILEPPARS
jgi:phosphoserine phosphatase